MVCPYVRYTILAKLLSQGRRKLQLLDLYFRDQEFHAAGIRKEA